MFFDKSPISMVKNVVTPSLLLIGEKDQRVPHAAAYYYYHALQEMGIEAKLLSYPESGHAIGNTEYAVDATMQISLWLDKYLMEPFEQRTESQKQELTLLT